MTARSTQIEREIRELESRYEYTNTLISLLMAEANLIDQQIETLGQSGLFIRAKIKDLKAELADTI